MKISTGFKIRLAVALAMGSLLGIAGTASALELDWSGTFRAELNIIKNYTLDASDQGSSIDSNRLGKGGYYIPPGGSNTANYRALFMKLKPKLVVNDNIYLKSEFWLGDPVYGFYGNATPYSSDQLHYDSTYSRGSIITAQRFWGEFLSDIGTIQVGRAPLHWGLGIVWNNGDGLWDHYESTGDTIRLISKFGSFSFIPSYVAYSSGNTIGGNCVVAGGNCNTGSGTLVDYSLILKYENLDEDFEGGLNYIKRLASASQTFYTGFLNDHPGMNYNIFDIYAKKKLGKFYVAGEAPITSGNIAGVPYNTFAIAAEGGWKPNDTWETNLKVGMAPGQASSAGPVPDSYRAFYFNPDYQIGFIMFNYQFANMSGFSTLNNPATSPSTLVSPYDNPIVNATYISGKETLHADKWSFDLGVIWATANQVATSGNYFLNTWTRQMSTVVAAENQQNNLGIETDLGATFQWDEFLQFKLQLGMFIPGAFYQFSNVAGLENKTDTVFAGTAKVAVTF